LKTYAVSVLAGRAGITQTTGNGVGQRQQQKTRHSGRAVGQISNPAKMDGLAALLTFC
jgi:hypothetical protein